MRSTSKYSLTFLEKKSFMPRRSSVLFFTDKVAYLGFIVSREELSPDPKKVEAIVKWPIPKCVTDVRSFMGLAGWFQVFVKEYDKIT